MLPVLLCWNPILLVSILTFDGDVSAVTDSMTVWLAERKHAFFEEVLKTLD